MTRRDASDGQRGRVAGGTPEAKLWEERKSYTTQLQRRAQAHVTAELGVDTGEADIDRQVAMLIQHALAVTGARRVTLFRPAPRGQRWHAATGLDDGCFYYGLIAPKALILPMVANDQKRPLLLGPDRPHAGAVPRLSDLGFRSYVGVPVMVSGEVVAVLEAVDVAQVDNLDRYAASLAEATTALAQGLAADARRRGWRPAGSPAGGLSEGTVLDLVMRPPFEPDDSFEISAQEWTILHQLNGERPLGEVATAAGLAFPVASTVAASLLERGLARLGREIRRRL